MKTLILIYILFTSSLCFANFPETFGSSPTTNGLAGQSNGDNEDPSNTFYFPAGAAFSEKINLQASMIATMPNFESIDNILVLNNTNDYTGNEDDQNGSANTNYDNINMNIVHAILPLKKYGALSFSGFFPLNVIMETNSGHPFLPEYVMHRSRYKRTQVYLNYAYRLSDSWGISAGVTMGMQTGGNMNTIMNFRDNSNNNGNIGSFADTKLQVKPNLGGQVSIMRDTEESQVGVTLVQEIKHNIKISTFVATGKPTPIPNSMTIENMQYYDPWTLRLSYIKKFDAWDAITNLEIQSWDGYKTPVVRLNIIDGTLQSSSNFETVKTKTVFIPKVGIKYKATENLKVLGGLSYRPTPLDGDFSGPGNSIDTDAFIVGGGLIGNWKLFDIDAEFSLSAQFQQLKEKKVTKSSGLENGSTGNKLGSPGYTIGGNILSFGAGIKIAL